MSNPILVVDDDYTVYYQGRTFALGSPPQMYWSDNPFTPYPRLQIKFDCIELPPPPRPKPKRTWANAMGLRKPRT